MMLARCYAAGVTLGLVLFLMTALEAPPGARVALAQDTKAEKKVDEKKVEKKTEKIKPYDEVVTKDARTSAGLFIVHRVDDKVYFEIPIAALGKDMLWVTQMERTPSDMFARAGSPVGNRVVRWEQKGDDVLLRDINYRIRADVKDPIRDAVEASSLKPIIDVFPVKAYGKDKRPVIDATDLYKGDLPEFSAKSRLDAQGVDSKRTFIEEIKTFPGNLEAKVTLTYKPKQESRRGGITVLLHHSMVRLPEDLMKPRKHDDRVGFFSEEFEDYGDLSRHQMEQVRYITRWRLEKTDPKADLAEPKRPIVFYIGREVPDKWRPYIKKGVEAWQPAFEVAGFKKAIIARDAPSLTEDPDWSAEDARYSSIRWLPSSIENAMGPHVHDPRTGEILEADIIMWHNVIKLIRDWYFVQAAPNDMRAQKLPLPDELVGELLTYVTAHEVGHTLGFPHNMKASSSFTVEQLRDPKFTRENGTEASIMDYGRFNYVAQPGDGARLIPTIGPYDKFAVEWGYREFPDAGTYEQEKEKLDKIVARQIKDRTLLFGHPDGIDPSAQTEDLGSDAVRATELGLKNIDRVAYFLVTATASKGRDYELLRNMYGELVNQQNRELMHVANTVGGVNRTNFWYGDADKVYDPVQPDQQRKAVAFLVEHGLKTPQTLIAPDILQRLEPNGAAARIVTAQKSLLRALLSPERVGRMAECTARDPKGCYTPAELVKDLVAGIFSELDAASPQVDLYRRNLQRALVDLLDSLVNRDLPSNDLPALARGALQGLVKRIKAIEGKDVEAATRLHFDDLRARMETALDPRLAILAQPAPPGRPEN
jgi:hypothetical protein